MKVLDLDMDYFMDKIASGKSGENTERLSEEEYGGSVWSEKSIRAFLENNLGLSKEKKIRGRIVVGHNESLIYWKELIDSGRLSIKFDVVHVDSHADLGLGEKSWMYIMNTLLSYPVSERILHSEYYDSRYDKMVKEGIGDYLLFAIAYRWISQITYCGNPNGQCADYNKYILKHFKEAERKDKRKSVKNVIQLLYNPDTKFYKCYDDQFKLFQYWQKSEKEPEVPFIIIPTIEYVKYNGDFDFAVLAQSPNYTPASADFIMDIFREYIIEE